MTAPADRTPLPLPPGPPGGRIAQTVRLHRDPVGHLARCRAAHGDVFTIRTATAGPLVVVADPGVAGAVADLDPDAAGAGAARRRLLPQASSRSTFGGDGDAHAAARCRLAGSFAPDAIDARRTSIDAIVTSHLASWPRGRPVRLLPRLRCLADDVFVRVMLGVRDEVRARQTVRAIGRMLATPGNPPLTVPAPQDGLLGRAIAVEFGRRATPVRRALAAEVDARRTGADAGDDLVGALLRSEPERPTVDLVEELLPNIMAGQEPMAAAATWTLLALARRPDADVGTPEAARAFAAAALRDRPAALASLRRLDRPQAIAGHDLPAGAVVALAFPLVQQADDGPWMPFGGGARRCLGEALAWAQLEALLTRAPALGLRPVWPRPERAVLRATILVPARSGLVRLTGG